MLRSGGAPRNKPFPSSGRPKSALWSSPFDPELPFKISLSTGEKREKAVVGRRSLRQAIRFAARAPEAIVSRFTQCCAREYPSYPSGGDRASRGFGAGTSITSIPAFRENAIDGEVLLA
jgi:hypothetical protein